MHDFNMCFGTAPSTTVLNQVSDTGLYAKNGSNFMRNWYLLNPFGEMCFLEESYK